MERLRAVLFDMDGTLVDSNPQNTQAWVDTLTEGGYPVTYEQIYSLTRNGRRQSVAYGGQRRKGKRNREETERTLENPFYRNLLAADKAA